MQLLNVKIFANATSLRPRARPDFEKKSTSPSPARRSFPRHSASTPATGRSYRVAFKSPRRIPASRGRDILGARALTYEEGEGRLGAVMSGDRCAARAAMICNPGQRRMRPGHLSGGPAECRELAFRPCVLDLRAHRRAHWVRVFR